MNYRTVKNADFFQLARNTFLDDPNLGFAEKGLLTFLLSKPDKWKPKSEHLKTVGTDGRDAVRTMLSNLEKNNYLWRGQVRDEKSGQIEWLTVTFESKELYFEYCQENGNPVNLIREKKRARIYEGSEPTPAPVLSGTPDNAENGKGAVSANAGLSGAGSASIGATNTGQPGIIDNKEKGNNELVNNEKDNTKNHVVLSDDAAAVSATDNNGFSVKRQSVKEIRDKAEKTLETVPASIKEQAKRVLLYWRVQTGRNSNTVWDAPERVNMVVRKLRAGFAMLTLCLAVDGNVIDPHCSGDNERGKIYDDIELITRDAKHIEDYARTAESAGITTEIVEKRLKEILIAEISGVPLENVQKPAPPVSSKKKSSGRDESQFKYEPPQLDETALDKLETFAGNIAGQIVGGKSLETIELDIMGEYQNEIKDKINFDVDLFYSTLCQQIEIRANGSKTSQMDADAYSAAELILQLRGNTY